MDKRTAPIGQCVQHMGFLRRYVAKSLPIPSAIEDIVQQVITEFISRLDQWELQDDIRPLLIGIAKRTIGTYWRENSKQRPETLRLIAEHLRSLPSDELDLKEHDHQMEQLRICLDLLPEYGRSLINMYYFEEQTSDSIAKKVHKKREAVVRAIHRIREKLRLCVEREILDRQHE